MFFKQVRRNASKIRKNNGLFFSSLVIAIVAFYTLLSLDKQDIFVYLQTFESNAIQNLISLIPILYILSLFFMFFLVYFACQYQMESRSKEFGLYFMLGMKRPRLFFMLFCETLWSSLISLIIGLPIALFLTETISFISGKLVDLQVTSHTVSFSPQALLLTIIGYILVQLAVMLILCLPLAKAEPYTLLHPNVSSKQSITSTQKNSIFLGMGIILLLIAYGIGITHSRKLTSGQYLSVIPILIIFISGIIGTFFFYKGIGGFIGKYISKNGNKKAGLYTFTGRQVQENVINQHKALAITSLTMLIALSCFAFGISSGIDRGNETKSTDFSIYGTDQEIQSFLAKPELAEMTEVAYPVYLSNTYTPDTEQEVVDLTDLNDISNSLPNSTLSFYSTYTIPLSTYNNLLASMGEEAIILAKNEVALYTSLGETAMPQFDAILVEKTTAKINGETYNILPTLYKKNIVASRGITLYSALIVSDA